MTHLPTASDQQVHDELCQRLRQARIDASLTQEELAEAAGLSKKTISRAERGRISLTLSSLIPILRALGLIEQLDNFLPPPPPSPLQQRRGQTRERQRVRKPKREGDKASSGWTWGDES